MKLLVIGLGYVGLANAISLSLLSHEVVGVDSDLNKIKLLNEGISPLEEAGFSEGVASTKAKFFSSLKEVDMASFEAVILAVGTPASNDGSADMSYFDNALASIKASKVRKGTLIIRSTVPLLSYRRAKKVLGKYWNIISNPEFLSQGSALANEIEPSRIVAGISTFADKQLMMNIYKESIARGVPILFMSNASAELTKYAANDFLAMKISYINQLSLLAENIGADIEDVAKGIGSDKRIGSSMLSAGVGFGGSCFPKDGPALIHSAKEYGIELPLEEATMRINENQKIRFAKGIIETSKKNNISCVTLLGASFKSGTSDIRSSPTIDCARLLIEAGLKVIVFDKSKKACASFKEKVPGAEVTSSLQEALVGHSFFAIMTEEKDFLCLKEMARFRKDIIVYDGRNIFKVMDFPEGHYHSIGR